MASISTDSQGKRRLIVSIDGRRRTLRLGSISAKDAASLRELVDDIVAARLLGRQFDAVTVGRIDRLSDAMKERLAGLGLIKAIDRRLSVATVLGMFIDDQRSKKPATVSFYEKVRANLLATYNGDAPFHGYGIDSAEIAVDFLRRNYAPATAARRIKGLKTIWKWAVESGLCAENAFKSFAAGAMTNPARKRYIPASAVNALIEKAGRDLGLAIALSRFAGLRCPSEVYALKWEDIDWNAGTICVQSSKTGQRIIPIFAELRPHLEQHAMTSGHIVGDLRKKTHYKPLKDLLEKHGIEQWPRLWHNMRASCQTDLSRHHAAHVVCVWMGNSLQVAEKHYLQVTPQDVERAQQWTRAGGQTGGFVMQTNFKNSVFAAPDVCGAIPGGPLRALLKRRISERLSKSGGSPGHVLRAQQDKALLSLAHAYHRVMRRKGATK